MPRIIHYAFASPFTLCHARNRRIALKESTTRSRSQLQCTCPTVATAASKTQFKSTTSPRSTQPLRKALLALIVASATFLPTGGRPAIAAYQHTNSTAIARAVPRSSTLNTKLATKTRKARKSTSYDPHAAGTPFAIAGTSALLASAVAVAITHPIDTIKTIRQAKAYGSTTGPITLQSLYRGVLSNILKEAPNAAIYLAMYEVFKTALLKIRIFAAVPLLAMCVAGMLGDAVGSIVRVPAEIVNKRLQLGLSNGWNEAVKAAFLSENGLENTIAAWLAVLWRDVPYGGLQIAGYEFVRLVLGGWGMYGMGYSVIAGAVAGLFAAVMTTPADVLVTRMSTQSPQCYLETRQYMSVSATFRRIIRDEGFGALWTGALARGLFYMPMIGLFFAIYELFKYALLNASTTGSITLSLIGVIFGGILTRYGFLLRMFSRTPMQVGLFLIGCGMFRRTKG